MKQNNFVCLHEALKHCKRTFEECSQECKWYGTCGECRCYFIPMGQYPCNGCIFVGDNLADTGKESRK